VSRYRLCLVDRPPFSQWSRDGTLHRILEALAEDLRERGERKLRGYRRHWKVERLRAWLQNFRRVATRFDFHVENFLGFAHLGCIKILLRCYL
jgi:hypothetical protein